MSFVIISNTEKEKKKKQQQQAVKLVSFEAIRITFDNNNNNLVEGIRIKMQSEFIRNMTQNGIS